MEKLKILAVDDEVGVLKVIKDVLCNHDITTETSSFEAAKLVEKEKFDIYIVDYQMPGLNGIELLEEIQEECADKPYVCIFCTAYGTMHLFKEELIRGLFHLFVEKPYETDALKDTFHRAVVLLERMRNKS